MRKTNRGFIVYGEYTDSFGDTVRIQESSNGAGRYCWIFSGGPGGSPHLTPAQARRVAKALLRFADGPRRKLRRATTSEGVRRVPPKECPACGK